MCPPKTEPTRNVVSPEGDIQATFASHIAANITTEQAKLILQFMRKCYQAATATEREFKAKLKNYAEFLASDENPNKRVFLEAATELTSTTISAYLQDTSEGEILLPPVDFNRLLKQLTANVGKNKNHQQPKIKAFYSQTSAALVAIAEFADAKKLYGGGDRIRLESSVTQDAFRTLDLTPLRGLLPKHQAKKITVRNTQEFGSENNTPDQTENDFSSEETDNISSSKSGEHFPSNSLISEDDDKSLDEDNDEESATLDTNSLAQPIVQNNLSGQTAADLHTLINPNTQQTIVHVHHYHPQQLEPVDTGKYALGIGIAVGLLIGLAVAVVVGTVCSAIFMAANPIFGAMLGVAIGLAAGALVGAVATAAITAAVRPCLQSHAEKHVKRLMVPAPSLTENAPLLGRQGLFSQRAIAHAENPLFSDNDLSTRPSRNSDSK